MSAPDGSFVQECGENEGEALDRFFGLLEEYRGNTESGAPAGFP